VEGIVDSMASISLCLGTSADPSRGKR